MSTPQGPFSDVAALPKPLPVKFHGVGFAVIALLVQDGWLHGLAIDENGQMASLELNGDVRVVPQPGDEIRMAVGWAIDSDPWKALAAARRDNGQ